MVFTNQDIITCDTFFDFYKPGWQGCGAPGTGSGCGGSCRARAHLTRGCVATPESSRNGRC